MGEQAVVALGVEDEPDAALDGRGVLALAGDVAGREEGHGGECGEGGVAVAAGAGGDDVRRPAAGAGLRLGEVGEPVIDGVLERLAGRGRGQRRRHGEEQQREEAADHVDASLWRKPEE